MAIPSDTTFTLTVGVAYALGVRGLSLETSGDKPARAQFGEVIQLNSSSSDTASVNHAIQPVIVSGRNLSMDLFPVSVERPLTVLRDVQVSDISFDTHDHSSVLEGVAVIKSGAAPNITIQPNDHLEIRSKSPMLVRELTFDGNDVRLKLTTTEATTLKAGGDRPRDLMPTLFDWLRYRWSTQLWGTISALAAMWFALQRWRNTSK
jgi:hypothetical protein